MTVLHHAYKMDVMVPLTHHAVLLVVKACYFSCNDHIGYLYNVAVPPFYLTLSVNCAAVKTCILITFTLKPTSDCFIFFCLNMTSQNISVRKQTNETSKM